MGPARLPTPALALASALLLVQAACDEVRREAPAIPPGPPPLATAGPGAMAGDPVRGAAQAAAAAFAGNGAALAGAPALAAEAAARLEYLAEEIPGGARWRPIPTPVGYELRIARTELRAALGTRADAASGPVSGALSRAAAALRAGDRAAAARALPPGLFSPAGEAAVDRLGRLGPLPQTANATATLAEEMARLDLERRWTGSAIPDPAAAVETRTTTGLGGGLGY